MIVHRRTRRGLVAVAVVTACASSPLAGQTATVVDPGPGRPGRALLALLAGPHRVLVTRDSLLALPRDSVVDATIVIVGARRVTVASRVAGSVVVIGGDLFLHPGVAIEGDAIAFGGGVYSTGLGTVRGRILAYRDFTFDVAESGGMYRLTYRELSVDELRHFELPGPLYGVRIPSYDRSNGLSFPWGPRFNWPDPRVTLDPVLTYRLDLGAIDPDLRAELSLSRVSRVLLLAGRTTRTNEDWIRGALFNSVTTLFSGTDVRNYRRADRAEIRYERDLEREWGILIPMLGAAVERSTSVGPGIGATSHPWSLFKRSDRVDGMLRPNPPVRHGRLSSLLAGGDVEWEGQDVRIVGRALIEGTVEATDEQRFVQTTLDTRVDFPAFRDHTFRFEAHAIVTFGDPASPQRFSYLGGSGTLPTLDLLSKGGDHLLFVESRYTIPIERIEIRFLGSPSIAVRHMIGTAGVDQLPGFVNNVGLRLAFSLIKADFVIDPETRDTDFSVGLSFGR